MTDVAKVLVQPKSCSGKAWAVQESRRERLMVERDCACAERVCASRVVRPRFRIIERSSS